MNATEKSTNVPKKQKSIDDEILALNEKLKKLVAKKKDTERKERARNQKAVLELIASERLESVSVKKWESVMPQLKVLLGVELAKQTATQKPSVPPKEQAPVK